jgi:23S rRNA pseudouridine2605 synthase
MPGPKPSGDAAEGERIAKVLSRAGIASRREAERMIELGQVTVNGKVITSPALNVTAKDKITVAGQPVGEPETARLWLYYKPEGLVTSAADEKGRETVFDRLPPDMPRVMSVGRLDLNSEGLLLLTNDGELKRRLELPSTGWLRKYRVRVKGNPTDPDLEPLRKGITVDGERFQPMSVTLDRVQGANAWLTVGLREGKNREIRRAMSAINLTVNRLIRVSYGPFRLGDLEPGAVEEVRGKVLRDQLGLSPSDDEATGMARAATRPARPGGTSPRPGKSPDKSQPRDRKTPPAAPAREARLEKLAPPKTGRGRPYTAEAARRDAKPVTSPAHAGKTGRASGTDAKSPGMPSGRAADAQRLRSKAKPKAIAPSRNTPKPPPQRGK